ncbi:serine/threonine protein kinase psk1 [Puttea exsequens]|nr:serine/threonine protein kinase psk1 [Puttea exsequens]
MSAEIFAFDVGDIHSSCRQPDQVLTPPTPTSLLGVLGENKTFELGGKITFNGSDHAPGARSRSDSPRDLVAHSSISELEEPVLSGTGTPPIAIAMTPTEARSRSRARAEFAEDKEPECSRHPLPQISKGVRRRKKHPEKSIVAALSTVRGFTPATSGDEDSDWSAEGFRRRKTLTIQSSAGLMRKDISIDRSDANSQGSCQGMRSSSPSVSALSRQLEGLDYGSPFRRPSYLRHKSKLSSDDPTSASVSPGTSGDEETVEMTSYEVPLEHDFISSDVSAKEVNDANRDVARTRDMMRKMQATDFDPFRCLGKGTYGTVLLVKQRCTGKLYAQKQFRKASLTVRKKLVEQTKTERSILESINRHAFVVKLYYAFQDQEKLYLILEYAQGGELFERMRQDGMWPEETAAFYMAEMVLALEHLHGTVGVVYRDLKPENCLLDAEGHLLLTDFGLSKVAVDGEHHCRSMAGTIEYMAPEVIEEKPYGTAVDWWSFGILGFDLMTGSTPFRANNPTKTGQNILKNKPKFPYYASEDAKSLLNPLLRKDPKKRLGANMPKDLQTIKKHRFFRKIDWKGLGKREMEPPVKPFITNPELAENFSTDFTELALSPPMQASHHAWGGRSEHDQFGGFSFVGSRSLLEADAGS